MKREQGDVLGRLATIVMALVCVALLAQPADARRRRAEPQISPAAISPEEDVPKGLPKVGELVTINLNGQILNYWETGKLGQTPLIIFSHGFGGCGTNIAFLASELAKKGWLVVAPDHSDAACKANRSTLKPLTDPTTWDDTTFVERRDELRKTYRSLRSDAAWRNRIDWSRVAVAGHSLGGYTALAMAGGLPAWRVEGFSAVLALSPYCAALSMKGALHEMQVPVMYLGGNRDAITGNMVVNSGGCFERTSGEASFVEMDRATHMSFTNFDGMGHSHMVNYATQFFAAVFDGKPLRLAPASGVSMIKQK